MRSSRGHTDLGLTEADLSRREAGPSCGMDSCSASWVLGLVSGWGSQVSWKNDGIDSLSMKLELRAVGQKPQRQLGVREQERLGSQAIQGGGSPGGLSLIHISEPTRLS